MNNNILPAIRNIKDLEKLIKTDYKMCVLLDMHIGHIKSIMELLKQNHIECFIHIDLIKGLSHDEFASEFIIDSQALKRSIDLIKKAKSLNTLTIFRVFIIQQYKPKGIVSTKSKVIKKVEPDFVEVLPGVASKAIHHIQKETNTQVIAGGLINTIDEVNEAVKNGAKYVTTSYDKLW